MKTKRLAHASLAIAAAVSSSLAVFLALQAAFLQFQVWHFRRFIKPADGNATALPFEWVVFIVLPLLASLLGGAVAGIVFRRASMVFCLLVGLALGGTVFLTMLKHPPDWGLLLFSLLVAAVGSYAVFASSSLASRMGKGTGKPVGNL
jgi:hypothetical protein